MNTVAIEQRQGKSARVSRIRFWEIAERVFVVTESDATSGRLTSTQETPIPASVSELVHMIAASPELVARITISSWSACRAISEIVPSWSALAKGQCSSEMKQLLAGSTLLLMKTDFCETAGWAEMEGLRWLGIKHLLMLHPYDARGSVVSIAMSRTSAWRERFDTALLARSSIGRSAIKRAWAERGLMWIAGPSSEIPGTEKEMSDQFALFEGTRQLPPLPVAHEDIRRLGRGRYSVWSNHVFFSSTRDAAPPKSIWMVPSNPSTRRRLRFVSAVLAPSPQKKRLSFRNELAAAIQAEAAPYQPPQLRPGETIVVLTHALPPGGAERQWCYLAGDLKRAGYKVHFVALFPLDGQNRHYLPLLASEGINVTQLGQELDQQGLLKNLRSTLIRIRSGDFAAAMENPFGYRLGELVNLFVRLQPRVVFAQLDYANLIAGAAGLLASVPQLVLSFRNYNPTRFSYLANDWYQPLYAILARSPRILLTGNSRAANADYAQWIGVDERRVKHVPNAIDTTRTGPPDEESLRVLRQEFGVTSRTPLVLGVFRLSEEKRPHLFIETFARVASRLPGARALIAGVGPLEQEMREHIDELGLQDSLTLLGRRDDVPRLMQISSLLLLTSSFEGMPNVVMEAQAEGCPVVASNVGGVPDCLIDGQTGYLVDRDDIVAFSGKCIELLENEHLRTQFGARAAAHMSSQFSRRAMAERYLHILKDGSTAPARKAGLPTAEETSSPSLSFNVSR